MGRREGRVPCSRVCSAWLRHFRTVEWLEERSTLMQRAKVIWGKTKQNLSSTCGRFSVMFLMARKGKWELAAHTWMNSLLSMEEGLVQVWLVEMQKWLNGWAGKPPQWKRLSKHYLINHLPFPSYSVNLQWGLYDSIVIPWPSSGLTRCLQSSGAQLTRAVFLVLWAQG